MKLSLFGPDERFLVDVRAFMCQYWAWFKREGLDNRKDTYCTSMSLSSDSSKASARKSKLRGSWWCGNTKRNWEG